MRPVLVAMNPAALKANLADVPCGADIIVNTEEFTKRNLSRVGYQASPGGRLANYNLHVAPVTSMTSRPWRSSASPARTPSGRRTCGRSACCPGPTAGRSSPRSRSSNPSSRPKPEIMKADEAALSGFGVVTTMRIYLAFPRRGPRAAAAQSRETSLLTLL